MIVDEKYLLDQQKEEIEFLAEDRDRYKELFHQAVKNRDEFVALADVKQKQLEIASKNYNILYNEKVELQKQVNELTEQKDVFKRLFESVNKSHITSDEIINTMNSFYREQAEHLAELKIEKTVKDTAKDILQELWDETEATENDEWVRAKIKEIAKRKGVEVE